MFTLARSSDLAQVEHIRAERGILTQIKHPFIVNLLGTFQDDHRLFMVMEYVIGGELFSLLGNVGRLQHQNAQFYAAEIALAFEYLHSLGLFGVRGGRSRVCYWG